jgi:hypothetical protein
MRGASKFDKLRIGPWAEVDLLLSRGEESVAKFRQLIT